ncbi:uncharacterized protein LOC110954744 [Acanthochromis polyacanthus]|uniref:uncharacterized protein LOC110954744 n=1 Tax=Acanthochromis polyacanthus TaxID=80966 RepID=UPI0022349B49|nr:uncharacterized protein LOC110954744 [Acanthochromis polyacanthus]
MLLNDFFTFERTDYGSFEHCCVPLCNSSSKYNTTLSFHKFPPDPELRRTWIESIQREKLHVSRFSRVCSRHFTGEDFQEDGRQLKPGAVPVLFEWNQYSVPGGVAVDGPVDGPAEEPEAFLTEHNYALASETELKERIGRLTGGQRFGLQRFAGSDEDLRFFTRFASYDLLMGFWTSIEHLVPLVVSMKNSHRDVLTDTNVPAVSSLQPIDEMLLLLNYLALGSKLNDLADRYGIQPSAVRQIITKWSNFLYTVLGSVNIWIPEEKIRKHLPAEFEEYANTTVILGCMELRYQRPPSSLLDGEDLSTQSNSSCTLKGLFGVAPHGAVTFVSQLFAGSVRDDHLIRESGILKLLRPGMGVMVDQGFPVDDLSLCKIYMPAFLSPRSRMSGRDVRETLASVHVEHLISRVKDHRFFDTEIPLQLLGNINQLYTVACLLTNYENGLLGKTERLV